MGFRHHKPANELRTEFDRPSQKQDDNRLENNNLKKDMERKIIKKDDHLSLFSRSRDFLQSIFDCTAAGICVTDENGLIMAANDAFCNLYGYNLEELIDQPFTMLLSPEYHENAKKMHQDFLRDGGEMLEEWEVVRKNGEKFYIHAKAGKFTDQEGKRYKVTSITDVTQHKCAEQLLKEKENVSKSLLNATLDSAFLITPSGFFLAANEMGAKRLKSPAAELIGKNISEVLPPNVYERRMSYIRLVLKEKKPVRFQDEREGLHFDNYLSPIFNAEGQITKVALFAQDITERKKAEEALLLAKASIEHASECIFWIDERGEIAFVNQAVCRMLGYTRDELISKTISFVEPAFPMEKWSSHWQELKERKFLLFESRYCRKNGSVIPAEVSANFFQYGDREYIFASVRDISEKIRQHETLVENIYKFKALFDLAPDAVFLGTLEGEIIDCNEAAVSMTGYPKEELVGMSSKKLLPEYLAKDFEKTMEQMLLSKSAFLGFENQRKNGDIFPVEMSAKVIEFNKKNAVLVVVREITERKEYEQKLKLFQKVFENALEGITITDAKGNIVAVNEAFTEITGYKSHEVIGKNPRILKSDRHDDNFYKTMWQNLKTQGQWEGEIWNRRKTGEAYPEWLSISAIKANSSDITHYVAVFHDITDLKHQEEQIKHQAYHDALTNLPNRLLLHDRLSVAINHAQRNGQKIAILFVDLDNFKHINDSLGHALGDQLLQAVSQRIVKLMREEDTVSRLGGDEFVIMLEDVKDESVAIHIAERVLASFQRSFHVRNHELFITPSLGLTLFPDDGSDPETLIKNADLAMYRAKDKGKNRFQLFTSTMNDRVTKRLEMEGNLRKATEGDEFLVYYQPKIDIRTEKVTGMEALVRWQRPTGELVNPGDFIPLAEETGLIVNIGQRVLETACQQTKLLHEQGMTDLKVSVNFSPRQFQQSNVVDMIINTLQKTGLDPSALEIEITETIIMSNVESTVSRLQELSRQGISISIDDFGTGYSSLYYLKHLPIHVLKIDKSFIHDLSVDVNDSAIVETIILMAKNLNLRVIAEGVETQEQFQYLRDRNCDDVQGYLFSPPLPLSEFEKYLLKDVPLLS